MAKNVGTISLIAENDDMVGSAGLAPGWYAVCLTGAYRYIGYCQRRGDWLYVSNARNLRVWGTARGFVELLEDGPQKGSQIDALMSFAAPMQSVVHVCTINWAVWEQHLVKAASR